MTRYTEDNVTDLVATINELLEDVDTHGRVVVWPTSTPCSMYHQLVKVMAPFRPDPDEALVEEMADVIREQVKHAIKSSEGFGEYPVYERRHR